MTSTSLRRAKTFINPFLLQAQRQFHGPTHHPRLPRALPPRVWRLSYTPRAILRIRWPMIIPSIDLLGGKAVQLRRGNPDDCAVTVDDPVALAQEFARYGEVAVIDLDAALGRGDNLKVIEQITARVEARVGGGIRDHARADHLLRAGAKKLILGTAATPEFLSKYPRNQLIVALDAKQGRVVTEGWTHATLETM